MSLLTDALPDLLSAIGAAAVIALASAAWRRLSSRRTAASAALEESRTLRRYTLLRTTGPDGAPEQYETTRPTGTVITHRVDGRPQRFELTDIPLGDGTFAAEPYDHM
ncbi:hypothetical protein GCM10010293_68600 [Streptomyces griseoflavus]|uniref:hypothetical protein n=1 Tax=Streptomyces griseoflavus TaxID=35619 RepID=UPI00167C7D3D|nr:hypothetical protein [Streptomyces griseoflavus]GGV54586.1 hypothetical protein GCM10010293_68600 [Streptomyces griseoflavus]